MATVSRQLAQFSDENGQPMCTINVEYNDATMRISGVRAINNGSGNCYAAVIRSSDRLLYGQTFPLVKPIFLCRRMGRTGSISSTMAAGTGATSNSHSSTQHR